MKKEQPLYTACFIYDFWFADTTEAADLQSVSSFESTWESLNPNQTHNPKLDAHQTNTKKKVMTTYIRE